MLINFLSNSKSMWQVVNLFLYESTTWLRNLTVIDGLFCAYQYFKHKVLFDGKETKKVQKELYDKRALTSNYALFTIERYVLYTCVYSIKLMFHKIFYEDPYTLSLFAYIIVIPGIQNALFGKSKLIRTLRGHIHICGKYILAKVVYQNLCKVSRVDPKNMDIFAIYKILNTDVLLDMAKSYLTISVMYIMRNKQMTYYYYKAVKLAYYYNTGYLFNTMDPKDAIFLIQHVMNNGKWKKLSSIEFIHALYVLFAQQYNWHNFVAKVYCQTVCFFAIWSCFSFLKAIHYVTSAGILLILWAQDPRREGVCIEKGLRYAILYICLVLLGIDDFVATVLYLQHTYLVFICKEVWFYLKNYKDIRRIMAYYDKLFVQQEYIVL